jgi:dephospho-CoA kinase
MKTMIGLVGEKFSGKDEVAKYLVGRQGAYHSRFSHVLDDILKELDLPISRRNEIDLGLAIRKVFGPGILSNAVIKRAENSGKDFIVFNGIRMDEMVPIRQKGALIVYVTAPAELRYERFLNRKEKTDDASQTFEQFLEQEKELTEVGIPSLGAGADFKIENTGTLEELYKKVDEIVLSAKVNH